MRRRRLLRLRARGPRGGPAADLGPFWLGLAPAEHEGRRGRRRPRVRRRHAGGRPLGLLDSRSGRLRPLARGVVARAAPRPRPLVPAILVAARAPSHLPLRRRPLPSRGSLRQATPRRPVGRRLLRSPRARPCGREPPARPTFARRVARPPCSASNASVRLGGGRREVDVDVASDRRRRTPGAGSSRPVGIGSNLWSWQRAQPIVRPRKAGPVVAMHVVELVVALPARPGSSVDLRAACQPRQKPVAISARGFVGLELVAGELPADEPVVGHVVVERLDHEVAIAPGVRAVVVVLEAVGLGVADQVEPVPRPALAVVRAGEQPVDQPLVGVGAGRRRRRPRPPRASAAGRSGRRSARRISVRRSAGGVGAEALLLQLRQDEAIDRRARTTPRPATGGGSRAASGRKDQNVGGRRR